MVKVVMTGRHEVKRVQIEPSVVGEDREMLEDLIAAAINDAVHRRGERHAGQDVGGDGRPVIAAGREAAVLSGGAPTMKHSPALAALIEALRALPGVGPKSAQRMAFHLLQSGRPAATALAAGAECGARARSAAAAAVAC